MCNTLLKLKKVLPFESSQQAQRKRVYVWSRWDSGEFGFLSLSDIKLQLMDLLDLQDNTHLDFIINLAYKKVRELADTPSNFNGEFLERRYFRLFVETFTRLLEKMLLFQYFDHDRSDQIDCNQLIEVRKVFKKLRIDCDGFEGIEEIASRKQLNLDLFIDKMVDLTESNIHHII